MSHCLATFIKIPLTKSFIKTRSFPSPQHSARSGKRCSRSLSPSCGTTRVPKPKRFCSVSPFRAAPLQQHSLLPWAHLLHSRASVLCFADGYCTCSCKNQQHNLMQKSKLVIFNCLSKALQTLFFTQYCRLRSLQQQRRAKGACAAQSAAVGAGFTSGTDGALPRPGITNQWIQITSNGDGSRVSY